MYFGILVSLKGFPFLCPAGLPREYPMVSIEKTALELLNISWQGPPCGSAATPPMISFFDSSFPAPTSICKTPVAGRRMQS